MGGKGADKSLFVLNNTEKLGQDMMSVVDLYSLALRHNTP